MEITLGQRWKLDCETLQTRAMPLEKLAMPLIGHGLS